MPTTFLRVVRAVALAAALLVPAASRAQTAPPPAASSPRSPGPASSPVPSQDPLAGWQTAPSFTPAPGHGPHDAHGWPRPASGAYPTYGAAASPTQRPFVPPRKEARSPGAVLGGTALALGGGLHILGGLQLAGQVAGDDILVPELAAVAIIAGVHCIGGGVVLIVWGTRERWVRGEATAAPVVRVGATSASATWSF